jgi:alkanesulfonate monooxygenase SsuD/methylene tetrahydromethanopterin reductase-like flavin-dependent oxidoreductase (luciferase family)
LLDGETVIFKRKFFEVNRVKLSPDPIQRPHRFGSAASRRRRAAEPPGMVTASPHQGPIAAFTTATLANSKSKASRRTTFRFAGGFNWLIA